jgi:hypothetical protein
MWSAEITGRRRTRSLDRPDSQPNVAAHVEGTLELELAMEVAVIPELMAFLRHAPHELGPTLGVTSQDEKRRMDSFFGERVEDQRSGIWVRAIIEGERDDFPFASNSSEGRTKERTVTVKRSVHRPAYHRHSQCCVTDHSRVARPNTAV